MTAPTLLPLDPAEAARVVAELAGKCRDCDGSGDAIPGAIERCLECDGTGRPTVRVWVPCPLCANWARNGLSNPLPGTCKHVPAVGSRVVIAEDWRLVNGRPMIARATYGLDVQESPLCRIEDMPLDIPGATVAEVVAAKAARSPCAGETWGWALDLWRVS